MQTVSQPEGCPTAATPARPGAAPVVRLCSAVVLASLALALLVASVSRAQVTDDAWSATRDPLVAAILTQVTTHTLVDSLEGLSGERPVLIAGIPYTLTTRYTLYSEAILQATRYAYEQLARTGLPTTFHTYTYSSHTLRNVIAEKVGQDPASDAIYLITAHLDSTTSDAAHDPAPGADDNATGSVAVLLAARLLAPYEFSHTVRFVLFTGEEQGLRGSAAYAAKCLADGDAIRGVLNLDMVGYNTGDPVLDLYARSGEELGAPESRQLADLLSDVIAAYALDLLPTTIATDVYPLRSGSDQWSFLARGYPGILVIEDYNGHDSTPYYHSVNDRVSTLDLDYYAEATRAAIATIAHLGGIQAELGYLSGTLRVQSSYAPLTGSLSALGDHSPEAFLTQTDANGGYLLTLPTGSYTLTATALAVYCPTTVTGLIVTKGLTTLQEMLLAPCVHQYLPLLMREWQIAAQGAGAGPRTSHASLLRALP
ncbi:MAG: M20/M25/M40 family metallo-hydrolase [Anaerolineales bacterium]|nr:M20/M25/M40 family metallo-hydrolase [Anaerolineales bacterium]